MKQFWTQTTSSVVAETAAMSTIKLLQRVAKDEVCNIKARFAGKEARGAIVTDCLHASDVDESRKAVDPINRRA